MKYLFIFLFVMSCDNKNSQLICHNKFYKDKHLILAHNKLSNKIVITQNEGTTKYKILKNNDLEIVFEGSYWGSPPISWGDSSINKNTGELRFGPIKWSCKESKKIL
jgi:hypothetical protein